MGKNRDLQMARRRPFRSNLQTPSERRNIPIPNKRGGRINEVAKNPLPIQTRRKPNTRRQPTMNEAIILSEGATGLLAFLTFIYIVTNYYLVKKREQTIQKIINNSEIRK